MPDSALADLVCSRCSRAHDPDRIQQLCECGAPLLARYDLAAAARTLSRESLKTRLDDLWRFRELLPVRDDAAIVSLGERPSPIVELRRAGDAVGTANMFCKDEGGLPTGSFKARGAAVGLSRARELGVRQFALPTNGNAGSAWSAYAARAGMRATVVMPGGASHVHQLLCAAFGARVFLVDGLISDAGRIVARSVSKGGLYDVSTLKEPYRIEGKKTLGFEIAEQFGWKLPDVIVYPTGGGVGLIGMHKAFVELQALGLLGSHLPRFFAVQSTGCAPIVRAWRENRESSTAWEGATTIAFGINVPKAIGDFIVLRILRETKGAAIAVDDARIIEYQRILTAEEGVLACAEGGACLAGVAQARRDGLIRSDERVLIINTGSGALDPAALKSGTEVPVDLPHLRPDDEFEAPPDL